MPQSLCSLYTHIVFSTLDRVPFMLDPLIQARVFADLTGISGRLECPVVEIGGVGDHVHLLIRQ
jgi:hypothetical protein